MVVSDQGNSCPKAKGKIDSSEILFRSSCETGIEEVIKLMKNKSGEECRMKIIEDSKGLVKEFEFILSTMSY